jgi:glycosyltransferase involved in cell wall biosynthesis
MNLFEMTSKSERKKVLLRGPVLTQSGYGVHTRQVAKWLFDRDDLDVEVQALPWGDTPWLIDKNLYDGFVGRIMERTVDPTGKRYDATVQVQLPNEWDTQFSNTNIGITASVETDRCNPEWVSCCNKMSLIIVPSLHAKSSLCNTGKILTRIEVIPEAYSNAILNFKETRVDELDFSTSFNFLIFGQITGNNPENERKNIFYTVKWLCEVFSKDPDAGIVIKTNSGRNTCIDRRLMQQTFEALIKEVRKGPFPRIHLIHGDMSDEEISSLYRHPKIKCLVSLTKGEGYGLPILEAAASGLPVMATNWSGHKDFLSHGKFIEIDYKLSEIHPSRVDNRIFMKGSKWANVIEDDFKKKVMKFRSASTIPKEWAKDLREKIQKKYSIEAVKSLYEEATRGMM